MDRYKLGKWTVDPIACTLTSQESDKQLEPKTMELLILLIKAEGEILSRNEIMETIWQGRFVTDHVLNNLVATLRKNLREVENTSFIKTWPKRGYQLTIPVENLSANPAFSTESLQVTSNIVDMTNNNDVNENSKHSASPKPNTAQDSIFNEFFRKFGMAVSVLFFVGLGIFLWQQLDIYLSDQDNSISVSISPFEVNQTNKEISGFAQGLVEETIHQLSSTTQLRVVTYHSNNHKKNTKAKYLLEGSVRPERNLVRVTTRLVNSETKSLLWSRVYTANLETSLSNQNNISKQITQTISDSLETPESLIELEQKSVPHEAYLHVLRGRKLNSKGTMEAYIKALDEFKMAGMIAPNYLDAHIDLALNYLILAQQKKMNVDDANREAYKSIQKALTIEPQHAKTHSLKATYHQNMGEFELAEEAYQKALEKNPELYVALINFANMLRKQHRYDESLALYQKAIKIAPRSSAANWAIGSILINQGKFDDAQKQYLSCTQLLPEYDACLAGLAYVQRMTNQNQAANKNLDAYVKLVKDEHYWFQNVVAWHYLWQGEIESAEQYYQGLVDKYGYAMDSVDSITLLKWRKGELSDWIVELKTAIAKNKQDKTVSALAYAHYLNGQCELAVNNWQNLLKSAPHYFSNLELIANGLSHQAGLTFCYKSLNIEPQFKTQLTKLHDLVTSFKNNQQQSLGFEFTKSQLNLLSGNLSASDMTLEHLKTGSLAISWMVKNDPVILSLNINRS